MWSCCFPGITGSQLRQRGKVVWGYSAGTIVKGLWTLGGSLERTLALPHDDQCRDELDDGIVADALIPDLHLIPGFWKIDGYTRITDAIATSFDVRAGENFFQFPYDWRRDNRVAARKLAKATHAWLTAWRQSSGNANAKLILIAHSMGGLVSRYFLECLEGWKDTKALITFGTPYRGSLNALDMLANGLKKGPIDLSKVAREFTSDLSVAADLRVLRRRKRQARARRPNERHPQCGRRQSRRGARLSRRDQERRHSESEATASIRTVGYRIYPVVGTAQQTNLSARLDSNKVTMLQTYEGNALGGDGTVPRVSAIPLEMSDTPAATYAATQHGSLQNADAVIDHLTGVLSGLDLNLGDFRRKPRIAVALEVEDLYLVGETVSVRARPRSEVALTAAYRRSGESAPLAHVPMTPVGGDWYGAKFIPPEPGAYRVTVSGEEVEHAEDAFAVVDAHEGVS